MKNQCRKLVLIESPWKISSSNAGRPRIKTDLFWSFFPSDNTAIIIEWASRYPHFPRRHILYYWNIAIVREGIVSKWYEIAERVQWRDSRPFDISSAYISEPDIVVPFLCSGLGVPRENRIISLVPILKYPINPYPYILIILVLIK